MDEVARAVAKDAPVARGEARNLALTTTSAAAMLAALLACAPAVVPELYKLAVMAVSYAAGYIAWGAILKLYRHIEMRDHVAMVQ